MSQYILMLHIEGTCRCQNKSVASGMQYAVCATRWQTHELSKRHHWLLMIMITCCIGGGCGYDARCIGGAGGPHGPCIQGAIGIGYGMFTECVKSAGGARWPPA